MSKSQTPDDKQGSFLRIESPSFSLELEGEPSFIQQSYDMIRDDIIQRLMAIIREHKDDPPPEPQRPAPLSPRDSPSAPRISESFRDGAIGRPNARDIKARMAGKRTENGRGGAPRTPNRPPSSPQQTALRPPAPPISRASEPVTANTPRPPKPRDGLKNKLTLASIPQLPPSALKPPAATLPASSAPPTPAAATNAATSGPRTAGRQGYVWVYITHDVFNKVYVAELKVFEASPLGQFLDGRLVKKVHLDHASLPAFKSLMGEGQTMWSELTDRGREQIRQTRAKKKP